VLANPVFVPVFFGNESPQIEPALADFASTLGTTAYWTAVTSEYGVGAATATMPVALTELALSSTDDASIQTWLAGKISDGGASWPAPTANTVYVLNYPSGTTISLTQQGSTLQSCQDFSGYHNSITSGGTPVAYAVIPRCAASGGLTLLELATATSSVELIDAATDPYPVAAPAYLTTDPAHRYWAMALGGGEAGELCAQNPNVFTTFPGSPYMVQRSWSNAAILAGHDPCQPELPGEVYFNSVPELTGGVSYGGVTMLGVNIAVNATQTIPLHLYSEGDTGEPWNVAVYDFASVMGLPATLTFSLDHASGQNGQQLNLSITVVSQGANGLNPFLIESSLGQSTTYWVGLVYTG
jgi:hypothetical protein